VRLSRFGPRPQARQRSGRERGSALALVPAMILLTVALGALVVDSAALFLASRQLDLAAQEVAKSAASGLSLQALYRSGIRELDPTKAEALAKAELSSERGSLTDLAGPPGLSVAVDGDAVCVALFAIARRPIAPRLLGRHLGEVRIHADALAELAPPGHPSPPAHLVAACSSRPTDARPDH